MTINQSNYELYALEYLEGTLSPTLQRSMQLFLETHPVIKEELEGMREMVVVVPDETIVFAKKAQLLKKEPKRVVLWNVNWPIRMAASVALLIGLMTAYQLQQTGDWNQEVVAVTPPVQVEKQQEEITNSSQSIVKINPEKTLNNSAVTKKQQIESSKIPALIDQLASNNTLATTTTNSLKTERKKITTSNQESTALTKSTMPQQNLAEKRQEVHFATASPNTTEENIRREEREKIHLSTATTRQQEEVATPVFMPFSERSKRRVATLPMPLLKQLPTTDRLTTSIETPIHQLSQQQLLAVHTPKKRTLKSLMGKLPGSDISVSILPSFFTDDGE